MRYLCVDFIPTFRSLMPLNDTFLSIGTVGLLFALQLPLYILLLLAFLFMPSILTAGARSLSVGKAIYCFLMQGVGVVMMSMGALPSLYSVLANKVVGQEPFTTNTYLGLLIVFAVGGLMFLLHEHLARTIDEPSRAIPYAIYFFTFKIIGVLAMLFGSMGLLLSMLFGEANTTAGWWIMPTIILLYGLVISYCTRLESLVLAPQKMTAPSAPTPAGAMVARTAPPNPAKPVPKVLIASPSMVAAATGKSPTPPHPSPTPTPGISTTTGSNLNPPKEHVAKKKATKKKK